MKQFIKTCYKCGEKVKPSTVTKDNVKLKCMKCSNCGEEYFTSSELIKYDIMTGKRAMIRKFGSLGNSRMIRLPTKIVDDFRIKEGDYGVFEERQDGFLIKPVSSRQLK